MSRKKEIGMFVEKKINIIRAAANISEGKAVLATLRKGAGKAPGELPQLFGYILQDMPEDFYSINNLPTKEEWACYIALTMFAWHQRGHDAEGGFVHTREKVSMGSAMRSLVDRLEDSNAEERLLKKLKVILMSNDINELSYHLRNIIALLSDSNIALNYSMLAEDIYIWQMPEHRAEISLKWGQDFYRINK